MHRIFIKAVAGLLALVIAPPVHSEEINIAVAANFLGAMKQLAAVYEQGAGDTLVLSSGASGQLYTQITQGAPFDVFLSADAERPRRLEAEGLAVPGSRFTYAVGTLVLWSPDAGVVDGEGAVLRAGRFRRLAMADPRTAPYGAAAQRVLMKLDLWDALNRQRRIVRGESINQAWQFVASGNVELAFVALSQVVDADGSVRGSHWRPPQSMYPPIEQDAVVLTRSNKRAAATAFADWLRKDPTALAAIKAAGYGVRR